MHDAHYEQTLTFPKVAGKKKRESVDSLVQQKIQLCTEIVQIYFMTF